MKINNTYNNVINQLKLLRNWDEICTDLTKISFKKTKFNNYAAYYNDMFLGIFIVKDFIKESELKEIGWKLKGNFGVI